jgi:5,10-methylenetetrahydromethanopterin reductase
MSLGVLFNGLYDAKEFIAFAKEAQALGVDSAWIAEQPGHRDSAAIAAWTLQATSLKVYPGAISPYSRHPMTIAMSAAALNELAPGRVGVVLGTGAVPNQAAYDVRVERPAQTMREAVESIRALLAGEVVEYHGSRFRFREARLGVSAPEVPIYLAAIGPKLQATAGRVADGVVFSSGHSPKFLAMSQQRVLAAHAHSPRAARSFVCAGFIVASVSKKRDTAYARTKALLSHFFSSPYKAEDWALNGVPIDHVAIQSALKRHDEEAATKLVGDELVELFSASGSPVEFQARIKAYFEVGLDRPVLAPLGTLEEKLLAVRLALEVAQE